MFTRRSLLLSPVRVQLAAASLMLTLGSQAHASHASNDELMLALGTGAFFMLLCLVCAVLTVIYLILLGTSRNNPGPFKRLVNAWWVVAFLALLACLILSAVSHPAFLAGPIFPLAMAYLTGRTVERVAAAPQLNAQELQRSGQSARAVVLAVVLGAIACWALGYAYFYTARSRELQDVERRSR